MSTWYVAGIPYSDELYHHGIKGQKWGDRRFQNKDGSLTPAGVKRYSVIDGDGKKNYTDSKGRQHVLSDKVKTMYNASIPKAKNVSEWFTGSHYKTKAEKYRGYADDLDKMSNQAAGIAYGVYDEDMDELKKSIKDKEKQGEKASESWLRQSRSYKFDSTTATISANKLEDMYQNAPRQVIQRVVNSAKEAAGNALNKASGAAKDVASWATESVQKGQNVLKKFFGR